jgi:multidrug efflux pump
VFSGMLGVTLFGLLLTPVFYVAVQAFGQRLRPSRSKTDKVLPQETEL